MTDRIIDITDGPAKLSAHKGLLVIERDETETRVPFSEISVLILAHPAIGISNSVLAEICTNGGFCVACNSHYEPSGMMLPMQGNHIQTERFAVQARAPLPLKKRMWQQIVRAKIKHQASLLSELGRPSDGIRALVSRVGSGDPQNIEAQAARKYWHALFGEAFLRNPDADDQNRYLNYGYTILRAMTARAICAAGLHPSLGLHHKNRYDTFCLASDLMEPFRPIVDRSASTLVDQKGSHEPLDKNAKHHLIDALLSARLHLQGDERVLPEIISRTATSLAAVYSGTLKNLVLPA
jgi:CRISPR-associated protein Cas1